MSYGLRNAHGFLRDDEGRVLSFSSPSNAIIWLVARPERLRENYRPARIEADDPLWLATGGNATRYVETSCPLSDQ